RESLFPSFQRGLVSIRRYEGPRERSLPSLPRDAEPYEETTEAGKDSFPPSPKRRIDTARLRIEGKDLSLLTTRRRSLTTNDGSRERLFPSLPRSDRSIQRDADQGKGSFPPYRTAPQPYDERRKQGKGLSLIPAKRRIDMTRRGMEGKRLSLLTGRRRL